MELKDKVVLITGSSQGIGRETALLFAKEGAHVVVTYHMSEKKGEEIYKECNKIKKSMLVRLDVTDEKSIKKCVEEVIDEFGTIDVLINNSGVLVWKSLLEQSNKEIDSQIDTNLKGLIKMTKAVLPFMKGQNDGMIINIASIAGKRASASENYAPYCATKFGVRGFTQAMANELPKGIKIFAVNPGMTATHMTDFRGVKPSRVAEVILKTAMGEIKPDENLDVDVWKHVVEQKPTDIYNTAKKKIGEIFGGEK